MANKLISGYAHLPGKHCESSAVRNLLNFRGIKISEPMIFGLGEGLNFIYWDMKDMDFAFTGGRSKPDMVYKTFAENAGIAFEEFKTASATKGWDFLKDKLDGREPVMLRLDSFFLDYFKFDMHFPAHYVVAAGYDNKYVYLSDTAYKSIQETSRESLAEARGSKISIGLGEPMHSCVTFPLIDGKPQAPDIKKNMINAIKRNAHAMLNPPIKNAGVKGIRHASKMIPQWIQRSSNPRKCLKATAEIWEHGGTGGGLFRMIYSDFLIEAGDIMRKRVVTDAGIKYAGMAREWTELADLLDTCGDTLDESLLIEVGNRVGIQADMEEEVLRGLEEVV